MGRQYNLIILIKNETNYICLRENFNKTNVSVTFLTNTETRYKTKKDK